jgi:hypothetical protein
MSFITNDNTCVCGHPKSNHVYNNKFESTWCELNQRTCDCWQYKARRVERGDFATDIKIEIVRGF